MNMNSRTRSKSKMPPRPPKKSHSYEQTVHAWLGRCMLAGEYSKIASSTHWMAASGVSQLQRGYLTLIQQNHFPLEWNSCLLNVLSLEEIFCTLQYAAAFLQNSVHSCCSTIFTHIKRLSFNISLYEMLPHTRWQTWQFAVEKNDKKACNITNAMV